ncbi:hypothetical protein [Burkholderia territorii]|uniref:hypothetical protein n=1 Tax=Burkholderia territorii TaxID=1503055 RepID=UPI0012DA71DF|nr:hypothetical protein [Burkholderia territorii]
MMLTILVSTTTVQLVVCVTVALALHRWAERSSWMVRLSYPLFLVVLAFAGAVWLAKQVARWTWGVRVDMWYCAGAVGAVSLVLIAVMLLALHAKGAIERQRERRIGLILEVRYPGVRARRRSSGVWQLIDAKSGSVLNEMTSMDVARCVRTRIETD